MPRPVKGRSGASEESPSDKSIPIWVAVISGVSGILVGVLPAVLSMYINSKPPEPLGVLQTAAVRLKPPVNCNAFPDDKAITRNEGRWLRDLCLNLMKEAQGPDHFPAAVFESTPISNSASFKGRVRCGTYAAIDGYAFLTDLEKNVFTPIDAYAEHEAGECAFRFEAPDITSPQSVLLVLVVSGKSETLSRSGIENLNLEVSP